MLYNIATIPLNINFTLKLYTICNNDTIGERIRKLRKSKGMTSNDLATKLGLTPAGIINYENNNAYPSPPIILKLYKLLGKEIACDDYSKFITSRYWERFKKWRNKNSLIKKRAATILGVSENTYLHWECQKTYITKYTFKRLKNKLKEIELIT